MAIEAGIGASTDVSTTTGGISVTASDTSTIDADARAVAVSASLAADQAFALSIGLSLAHNTIANEVSAYIRNVTSLTTGGTPILVSVIENGTITAKSIAAAVSAALSIGSPAVAVAGGASESTNIILSKANASIEDSALGTTANPVGAVTVSASGTATIIGTRRGSRRVRVVQRHDRRRCCDRDQRRPQLHRLGSRPRVAEQVALAGRGEGDRGGQARDRRSGDRRGLPAGVPRQAARQAGRRRRGARPWQRMAGRSGVLHTGQALFDVRDGAVVGRDIAVASTVVYFASPTPQELEAYVATGEPMAVAGAFTLDGLGAPFVRRVEGDPAAVVGLSLTVLRTQLAKRGLAITDLWRR